MENTLLDLLTQIFQLLLGLFTEGGILAQVLSWFA